ncbi:hypothetical protein BUALT_Bualt15G0001200 [Buddleja alternifolia]|uniref:Uncharacterized protein n=1 Tax=Buddleja alternifolia TaxID=168488 RepID=A0AAV6WJK9_9LAMI|nr:hypothetical protein BUALT_Bualt15G0001200 [Buddleja alternifolia]
MLSIERGEARRLVVNNGGVKLKPTKVSLKKISSSNPEEMEIEIDEVLFGLKTQSQVLSRGSQFVGLKARRLPQVSRPVTRNFFAQLLANAQSIAIEKCKVNGGAIVVCVDKGQFHSDDCGICRFVLKHEPRMWWVLDCLISVFMQRKMRIIYRKDGPDTQPDQMGKERRTMLEKYKEFDERIFPQRQQAMR